MSGEPHQPTFGKPGKRAAQGLPELLAYARERMDLGENCSWRLISSRAKLDKTLFEVEENSPAGSRILIGKVAGSEKAKGAFQVLRTLWEAGLRPPSPYCVPEAVAYLPERSLLIQERAAGIQLLEKIKAKTATTGDAERAAEWVLALQELRFPGLAPGSVGEFQRTCDELLLALPSLTRRLRPIMRFVEGRLAADTPGVPSHGDYHPMNLFLDEERVTAIDVDTFAAREPMFDVGYFLAQSAIQGFQEFKSFEPTEDLRQAFMEAIASGDPSRFRKDRIRVHTAFAFVRSLHFDFCILKANPQHLVDPFLSAAERALSEANIRLAA
jgi:hypothetical protein